MANTGLNRVLPGVTDMDVFPCTRCLYLLVSSALQRDGEETGNFILQSSLWSCHFPAEPGEQVGR
jgi:hypothetical protein